MIDVFKIKLYWSERKESVKECSDRLEIFFKKLREKESIFAEWHLTGRSKKDALNSKFDTSNIEKHLKDDNSKLLDELGFSNQGISLSLFKQDKFENEYGFSFLGGYEGDNFPNNLLISFWEPNILNKEEILELFELIINCLEPEWGCIDSKGLIDEIGRSKNRIGWFSFLKNDLLNNLPSGITSKNVGNDYVICFLSGDEWFDNSKLDSISLLKDCLS